MQKNPLFTEAVDEEDPRVIKELIDLIKKLGGIEQLERQLNIDATTTKSSDTKPTNQPVISKALYQKVLSGAVSGRSFVPRNRYSIGTQQNSAKTESDSGLVQGSVGANKYSSVIRNSRPEAQSAGVDRLSDNERVSAGNERPQYVTIKRPSVKPSSIEDDLDEDDEEEDVVEDEDAVIVPARRATTTSSPKYVNISRRRGTTTEKPSSSEEEEEDDNEEEEETTSRVKYNTFTRKQNQSAGDGVTTGGIR